MNTLDLSIHDDRSHFAPGDIIEGTARWRFRTEDGSVAPSDGLEVRLFWYTQGKGDRDVGLIESQPINTFSSQGNATFRFELPRGPLSFSGTLISLRWAIELVRLPDAATVRKEIVVAVGDHPIVLSKVED